MSTTKTTKTMKNKTMKTKTMKTNTKTKIQKPTKKASTRGSTNAMACNKQWLNSKKVRPKTVVIVAERTQEGYRIKSATVRVAVNQHAKTAIPITDLSMFVNDIKQKGLRS